MTDSMAARRRICASRVALVTRRPWPVAIIWVAVQRLGMKYELPALGRGDRSGNLDLAAELVLRAPCLGRCTRPRARATTRPLARVDAAVDGEPAARDRAADQRTKAVFELMMRPSRVPRNFSPRRARLNRWACV
jgi:hypothetical protein